MIRKIKPKLIVTKLSQLISIIYIPLSESKQVVQTTMNKKIKLQSSKNIQSFSEEIEIMALQLRKKNKLGK